MASILGSALSTALGAASSALNSVSNKVSSSSSKPSTSYSNSSQSSSGAPNNFKGSSIYLNTFTPDQDAIKAQMNANSQAWWNATTQAEKDALHQQNQQLAAQLGSDIRYDGHTGMWSGWADGGGDEQAYDLENYRPQDQSEYLKEMASAYLQKQQEALKQAYEQNLSDLQAEQDKLGVNYQAARNQEASDNALAKKRWNETANAYGLNSGTQGQAALSYSNQLQSSLSDLQAAESAANAEIERQRTDLGKQYQSAMVQAMADNNYQLFQALYQEAVRVDQALQNQSQYNASLALQKYQTALDQYYNDQSFAYSKEQADRAEQFDAAALLAQMGDYSAYGNLYGWTDAQVQQMENLWKMANTPTTTTSSGGGGGSYIGGSSSSSGGSGYDALFQDAMNSGYPESYIENNYKKYGFTSKTGLYDEYMDTWLPDNQVDMNKVQSVYNTISDDIRLSTSDDGDPNFIPKKIMQYSTQTSLGLNRAEVRKLFEMYGYDPDDWVE